jgi:hypothetical protein
MINPNQLGRRPFPAGASQWMLVGLRGTPPPPPGLNDGDPVTTWTDSSVNGNNATQTGSARPTFKTSIVNGKPVVRFVSASLQQLNLASQITSLAPWTVFSVVSRPNTSSVLQTIAGIAAQGANGLLIHSDDHIYFQDRTGVMNTSVPTGAAFHVITTNMQIGSAGFVYLDGTSLATSFGVSPQTGNFDNIGARQTPIYSDGDMAEIIIYNANLSGTDRANIEKYLGTKYAITVAGGSAVQPDTVTGIKGWWKADSLGT